MREKDFKDIQEIIKGSNSSTYRDSEGNTQVRDSNVFKGMSVSDSDFITALTENAIKESMARKGVATTSLDQLKKQVQQSGSQVLNVIKNTNNPNGLGKKVFDSIYNNPLNIGNSNDPFGSSTVAPNLWLSPVEANALYTQKGLPETIINKKSKSILLNGVQIKNSKLSNKQLDMVLAESVRLGVPSKISDAVRDSLVYGGNLLFPMFKKDNPITMNMNMAGLIKAGVVGKNCIDYIISLDRWATVVMPPHNPTHKDYLKPTKYYIPFLGSDVNGQRCSRIVTSTPAGWWGALTNLGWGLPDAVGYLQSVMNYDVTMQTVPMMIQQMSILARQINVDGILASEGANALDGLVEENTIKVTQWSPTNPVTMDVLGELKSIDRDFTEVPSLIKLARQDLAARATIPEPMLFSSDRGAFSSGDDTQGNLTKQWEAVKFIHKDVERQFSNFAKLLVINALGTSKEVLAVLPYTQLVFDTPILANAVERAEIGKDLSTSFFNLVGGTMPIPQALSMVGNFAGDQIPISSTLIDELQQRQDDIDKKANEKHEKEMELLAVQIENAEKQATKAPETGVKEPKKEKKYEEGKKKNDYTRLEQKQKTKHKEVGQRHNKLGQARAKAGLE